MKFLQVTVLITAALALAAELTAAQYALRVRLETQTKGTLVIGVKPNVKVDSLKQVVEENDGTKQDRQVLLYGDKVLSGDKLLSDYNMEDYAQVIVALLPPSVRSFGIGPAHAGNNGGLPRVNLTSKITVALIKEGETRNELVIEVSPTDNILDIKRKITKKTQLPLDRQRLIFNGANLQDQAKPGDYGIRDGSTVNLSMINTHVL